MLLLKIVYADITDITIKYFLKHKLPYFHKINYLLSIIFARNCYWKLIGEDSSNLNILIQYQKKIQF